MLWWIIMWYGLLNNCFVVGIEVFVIIIKLIFININI